jgi:hypothetical protein
MAHWATARFLAAGEIVHHMTNVAAGQGTFKTGQYVNTSDGFTGYIYEDNGEYQIAICERDEERSVTASDLTRWSPRNGERVVETGNDNSLIGIVVEAGNEISEVVWKGLLRQVSFVNSCLEPVWF